MLPSPEMRSNRLPVFPVIIGVTGHRDIAPYAQSAVRDSVRSLLKDWLAWFDPALHVLTALADGADQLVAEEALALGIPIIAVAPMPLADYERTITNRTAFGNLWDAAVLRLILPEVIDPFLAGPCSVGSHERQYEQLGVLLARRSHLLLALWDGGDDPTDNCGTGAVARMRLLGDHGAAALRGSPMFTGADSLLDMAWRGPLLRIAVQRDRPCPGADGRNPGTCILQGLPESPRHGEPVLQIDPHEAVVAMRRWGITDFDYIRRLNGQIAGFQDPDRKIFDSQLGYLNICGLPAEAERDTMKLVRLQAAADTAAQAYQVRLMGNFVPAKSASDAWANAAGAQRRSGRIPRVGAAFIFAAAVPLAVFLYEFFVHNHEDLSGLWALWLYAAVFAGVAAYYEFHVAYWEWQNRFQDYRALAEAMRIQLYWALAAVPAGVSDHYLRKQSGELGWIQFVLRGPALWAASVAETLAAPRRVAVRTGWIDDQVGYFGRKAPLHQHVTERCGFWAKLFLCAAIAVTGVLLLVEQQAGSHFVAGWFGDMLDTLQCHDGYLIVPAAALPALAAFFSFSRDIRAYEPHAHSYALMSRIFRRAKTQAEQPHTSDAEFQSLVRELGREALAENAEWLADHRHRKIEQHP